MTARPDGQAWMAQWWVLAVMSVWWGEPLVYRAGVALGLCLAIPAHATTVGVACGWRP